MSLTGTSAQAVGMGELKVARAPDCLEIRGLGSCIALALYDPLQRLAGLAHVVIPRPLPNAPPAPAWAATEAVPSLLEHMERHGGRTGRLVARIAGGSSMFPGVARGYEVGRENAEVVEALLREHRVPVLSRQVGGHASRRVRLYPEDGRLDVRTVRAHHAHRAAPPEQDPTEGARVLLEAAATPLSDVLQRPVVVHASGRHDLSAAEAGEFLGAGTPMHWSRLSYDAPEGPEDLHLVVPDLHARRVDEELRARLPEPLEQGEAISEVLNIMLSHALTALSTMHGTVLRPRALENRQGRTADLVAALRLGEGAAARVAHARLHLEGAFHGADVALIGRRLP